MLKNFNIQNNQIVFKYVYYNIAINIFKNYSRTSHLSEAQKKSIANAMLNQF